MGQNGPQRPFGKSAMCFSGAAPFELLSRPCGRGKRDELRPDETDRPAVSEAAVLRIAADDGLAGGLWLVCQREAGGAADASDGHPLHLARAAHKPSSPCPCKIPLLAAGPCYPGSESGLVRGHHVPSPASGVSVSCGRDGLVQPVCAGLGAVQFDGNGILPSGVESGADPGKAGDIEHRPGLPVHQRTIHGAAEGRRGADQHGRPGPCAGQRVHRAALALGQIRGGLPVRLCRRAGGASSPGPLLPVLQHRTPAPGLGEADPQRGVFQSPGGSRRAPGPKGGRVAPPSRSLKKWTRSPAILRRAHTAHSRIAGKRVLREENRQKGEPENRGGQTTDYSLF